MCHSTGLRQGANLPLYPASELVLRLNPHKQLCHGDGILGDRLTCETEGVEDRNSYSSILDKVIHHFSPSLDIVHDLRTLLIGIFLIKNVHTQKYS